MHYRSFLFFLTLFVSQLTLHAQKFTSILGYEGSVFSIFEESNGGIWFCTSDGLVEYDGLKFNWYTHSANNKNTISSNHVQSIYEDKKHNFWIGTQNGLNYFDRNTKIFTRYTPNNSNLSHHRIKQIEAVNDSVLFIATYGGGLNRFHINSKKVELLDSTNGLPSNFIGAIFLDKELDVLWVGSEHGGVSRLDLKSNKLTHYLGKDSLQHGFTDNNVGCFAKYQDKLLVGTWNKGIFVKDSQDKFSKLDSEFYSDFSDQDFQKTIKNIVFDKEGNWWIGTHNSLNFKNIRTGELQIFRHDNTNLRSIPVGRNWSLYCDKNGIVWAGFLHGGVCKYDPFENRVKEVFININGKKSKVDDFTSAHFIDSKNQYWLGTYEGKLQVFTKNDKKLLLDYSHFFAKGEIIYCINEDKEGVIWVCTSIGLHLIYQGKNCFFSKEVVTQDNPKFQSAGFYYVVFDSKQNVFLGGWNTGLVELKSDFHRKGKAYFEHAKVYCTRNSIIKDDKIWRLYMDSKDTLWISTDAGFYSFVNGNLELIDNSRDVFSVYRLNNGLLLRGHSNGLIEQWKNKQWISYLNLSAHIAKITSIYQISNYLMVSSLQGIVRVDMETKKVLKLTKADGLESNVTGLEGPIKLSEKGLVYLTLKGLSYVEPENIELNKIAPHILFRNLIITKHDGLENQANRKKNKFEISYDHAKLSVGFSCLNYSKNSEVKFYYKLVGLESKWQEVPEGQREIRYNSLDPGNYKLMMYGVNADGFSSVPEEICSIYVETPWWRSYFAYFLYLVFAILMMYFINSYSIIQIKAKNKLQLQQVLHEKDKEAHQAKINFFTNISHDLRTPLTLISAPIKSILGKENLDLEVKKSLVTVDKNTDFLIDLLNELLEFKKIESGTYKLNQKEVLVRKFIDEICAHYKELASLKNIELEIITSTELEKIFIDESLMSKVFHNLLANAFKYTSNGGLIQLHVVKEKEQIKFYIQDSGKGVSSELKDHLFDRFSSSSEFQNIGIGLALSKEIVLVHKGTLSLMDTEKGACFEITLPMFPKEQEETLEPDIQLEESPKQCVLLVEDNKEIAQFLRVLLNQEYIVLHANNGIEGIEIAKNNSVDLILSDVMMPLLDGVNMCKQLKQDIITSHIPVILLSAKTGADNELVGLQAEADDYLGKPFVPEILLQKIKNILNLRAALRKNVLEHSDELEKDKVLTIDDQLVKNLIELIENNLDSEELNVEWLSDQLAINRSHLSRKIKVLTGNSPMDFITNIRLKKAIELLQTGAYRVSDVAYRVGFSNPKYFSAALKKNFGKSPSDFLPNN